MSASPARAEGTADAGPRRYFDHAAGAWNVQLVQGDCYVSVAADEMLTTILGSCIAACIRDPLGRIGGMNHFLLPEGREADASRAEFGVNAMELLINGLIRAGGLRQRFEAKIFGGANVIGGLSRIGSQNAAFAERFLDNEGIPVVSSDVGGSHPRRIAFWPYSGRARRLAITCDGAELVRKEVQASRCQAGPGGLNDVELF